MQGETQQRVGGGAAPLLLGEMPVSVADQIGVVLRHHLVDIPHHGRKAPRDSRRGHGARSQRRQKGLAVPGVRLGPGPADTAGGMGIAPSGPP